MGITATGSYRGPYIVCFSIVKPARGLEPTYNIQIYSYNIWTTGRSAGDNAPVRWSNYICLPQGYSSCICARGTSEKKRRVVTIFIIFLIPQLIYNIIIIYCSYIIIRILIVFNFLI